MTKEIKSQSLRFNSYEEAEKHIFEKYFGHGFCSVIANVYDYTAYTQGW